ncbi:mediator complex, subunit Med7 [Zopfochytrium polystomum]|nr:mediator complex, subunit Med7 [Zopfochytrium polystomum]
MATAAPGGGGGAANPNKLTLQYPPPPPFYALYTDSNIATHKELKAKGVVPDLPLDPPPPLVEGSYTMFGEILNTSDRPPTLKELGIRQLLSDDPSGLVAELKNLNHSLLLNYLELTEILSTRPGDFAAKVEQIRLILINMHFALNSYRPHQARDVLRLMMEQQINRRREAAQKIIHVLDEVREKLTNAASDSQI